MGGMKRCDGRDDCMCDRCQATHFKELWLDALSTAADLFFLAEYLWGTCAERRDRKAFLNIMARAERECLTPDFLAERRLNTLAGQLKPDFDVRAAFVRSLDQARLNQTRERAFHDALSSSTKR